MVQLNQHSTNDLIMKSTVLILLLFLCSSAGIAQGGLPILDVYLHAVPADHLGPPPRAICTPMPSPAWDPGRPYRELFDSLAKNPPCPDPVWSPMTDEEMMNQTIEVMNRLNIVGVLSGEEPDRIAAWIEAAPDRFIPALVLKFGPVGADFSTDSPSAASTPQDALRCWGRSLTSTPESPPTTSGWSHTGRSPKSWTSQSGSTSAPARRAPSTSEPETTAPGSTAR